MPRGTRIRAGELAGRLGALDIDEGIRIEGVGGKCLSIVTPPGYL